jgi:hypothetical protein
MMVGVSEGFGVGLAVVVADSVGAALVCPPPLQPARASAANAKAAHVFFKVFPPAGVSDTR